MKVGQITVCVPTESVVREIYCKFCRGTYKHILTFEHHEQLEDQLTVFFRGTCTGCVKFSSQTHRKYTPPILTHNVDNWNALMRNK